MTSLSQAAPRRYQSAAGVHRRADSIFIVGGGPSLKGFDFDLLREQYVMCCNDSFRVLPWADAVISLDRHWIRNRRADLEAFEGRKYLCHREGEMVPEISDAVNLVYVSEPGLSESWDRIHGTTTGYAALNISMLLGARFIGLLGFDYQATGHWHDEYEWVSAANDDVWSRWAASFSSTREALDRHRIKVVNYNPRSAVEAFEKRDMREIGEQRCHT